MTRHTTRPTRLAAALLVAALLAFASAQEIDPRARELADEIIQTQKEEIAEMKSIIADLESR